MTTIASMWAEYCPDFGTYCGHRTRDSCDGSEHHGKTPGSDQNPYPAVRTAGKGSVIQIDPDQGAFGGCLAVVDEVKSFGVRCYVTVPGRGVAFYRVNDGDYEHVGEASWVRQKEGDGGNE